MSKNSIINLRVTQSFSALFIDGCLLYLFFNCC